MDVTDKKISYGERAVIGLITPNSGWNMEPEFFAMAPDGVSTASTRVWSKEVTPENLEIMGGETAKAANLLIDSNVGVILFGCTSGSLLKGKGYDQVLIKEMTEAANGIPSTTTTTAVIHAMHSFGAKKIAIGAPYTDEINKLAQTCLEDHGFEIVNYVGMGIDWDIDKLPVQAVEDLIRQADTPDADMVVILCTSMKGAGILARMEKELGKPIITATQASFWECLNILGIEDKVEGFGSLFDKKLK